ncbi:hypothetical protein JHK87_016080 [Glycine soja]|nr:hypothetical protein JHK87_016080 [Glycine soja]
MISTSGLYQPKLAAIVMVSSPSELSLFSKYSEIWAVLQMLEKQMGPESFRRAMLKNVQMMVVRYSHRCQRIVVESSVQVHGFALTFCFYFIFAITHEVFSPFIFPLEVICLNERVGNLERLFLKDFFPWWVGSCGCPVSSYLLLRMGFSYNKRKNMVELAVLGGCTTLQTSSTSTLDINWMGWYNEHKYMILMKPKKGLKLDGSDDNGDVPSMDMRLNLLSPKIIKLKSLRRLVRIS